MTRDKPNWLVLKQKIMNIELDRNITDIVYTFDEFKGANHFYVFFGKSFDISKIEEIKETLQNCEEKHKSNFVFHSCSMREQEIDRIKEMYSEVHVLT